MAFKDWIVLAILSIGWCTKSVALIRKCQNTPRIVYAIDSSQAVSKTEFYDQRSLVQSVVVELAGNAADVAVVLYSTHVNVKIKFGQFNGFSPLSNSITTLLPMNATSSGSDLEKLFNTTFTRTPEVLLMFKKEVNSTYPQGFRIPIGKLGGVKKIAVTFGKASNIKDISDFHTVLQVDDTIQFDQSPLIDQVASILCYALISTSTSNTGAATSIQINHGSAQNAASIPSPINSVVATSSSEAPSSSSARNGVGISSDHVIQQTASTGAPIMTVSDAFNITTQSIMNGMTETAFVASVPHTQYLVTSSQTFITPSSEENGTPVLAVSLTATNTSLPETSVVIAPSNTAKIPLMKSVNSQDYGHRIKKLMEDLGFVMNFDSRHVDVENRTFLQDYFNKAASLLHSGDFLDRAMNLSRQHESTPLKVLHALETFAVTIGEEIRKKNMHNVQQFTFHAKGLVSHIVQVNISTFQGMQLGILDTDNNSVVFPRELFSQAAANVTTDTGLLVSLVFDPFQVLQEPDTFDNFDDSHSVASKIVNVFTRPPSSSQLSRPVRITVQHSKNGYHTPQCVFWDYTQRSARTQFGKWSKRGCRVFSSNERHTECHCDHMTNYAILMRTTEQAVGVTDERVLTVLTYVGCSFSIVGVFLTAITFLSLPVIKSEITKIHLNLAIAVGLAQVLFLAAGSENLVQQEVICKLYTGLLFYFFMSVFTWMFVEGVHLYQMIVIAFVSRSMIKFYLALGWGLPACAVVIASSIARDGFGTSKFCWLSPVGGAIWGFVGPAVAIIAINLYVLVCVLRVRIDINKKEGSKAQFRASARVSLFLLPLLGISWIFGVLAVNKNTVVFQYIFTISNSIQGLLIFIFHCVGNSEVRHEFQRKASHLNLMRSFTSPSSPATVRARVSQIPLENVNPNKIKEAWG